MLFPFFISPSSQPLGAGGPESRTLRTVREQGSRLGPTEASPVPLSHVGLSAAADSVFYPDL